MSSPKPKTILAILDSLDWRGHIEVSEEDKRWLSAEIAGALSEDRSACGVCKRLKPIVVPLPIGNICEDCLEDAQADAEEVRDSLEEGE